MTLYAFLSFITYCFVTSVTPGPNNIMLISSGINFGFRKTIPHILGIGIGFGLMVALVGLGIGTILTTSPILFEIVKIIGIFYLLYLSYQIFKSDSVNTNGSIRSRPLKFLEAALFQWVNPKTWIMTMGAITTYTSSSSSIVTFAIIGIVFGVVSIPSVGVWAYIGDRLQQFINNKSKVKKFNILMSLLLLFSIVYPIYETFSFIINRFLFLY